MKSRTMKDNIFKISLKITLLIIFIFTNIGYVMPAQSSGLNYPSLRPLAFKNSESGPILIGDSENEEESDPPEDERDEEGSPAALAEKRLNRAKFYYSRNRLDSIAYASEILLDYIYSGDEHICQKAAAILKTRNNLFVISEEPAEPHKFGRIDYPAGTVPTKRVFENMVRAGLVKPVVIVNIKRVYPRIELAYAAEMRRISRYYNGNVTFILKVEEPEEFPADLPGVIQALHDTMDIMGIDFYRTLTIQIPDAGFKTRLGPVSLRYHKQGLVPYYREISYLEEVFTRAGRDIIQLPNDGRRDHIICASDTISEPGTFRFDKSLDRGLQMAVVERPQPVLKPGLTKPWLLFAGGKPQGFVGDIPSERIEELLKEDSTASIKDTHYLTIWNKRSLSDYMDIAYSTKMEDGRPIAHAPVNIHREFLRSVFFTPEEWMQLYHRNKITTMTVEDWMELRELALEFLGEKAEKVEFVTGQARDEGMLERLIARFRKRFRTLNRVKRDPGIMLGNATEAMLDHVIFRGKKGNVIFGGPNVRLRNVIIELKEGETLYIPDGWVIKDSYIGKNTFEEGGGLLIGATLYKDEELHPLRGKIFKSNTCNSVISRLDREPLFISASFDTPTDIITEEGEYKFEELQWQVDAAENQNALFALQKTIAQEFERQPAIFPLNIKAAETLAETETTERIHDLAREIIKRQEEAGGGQYWVFIEGIQGAGKTFFAKRLGQSLRALGKNVAKIEEDWYHKPRPERNKLSAKERKRHSVSWHNWDDLQEDIERICRTERGRIELSRAEKDGHKRYTGGYRRYTGRQEVKRSVNMTPDTIVLYTGFYTTHDIAKFYSRDITHPPLVLSRPSLRIYLGMTQEESLRLKLRRDSKWRPKRNIRLLDRTIFRPAFQKYITTYDPASDYDYIFRINPMDRSKIAVVEPHTISWRERRPREELPPAVKNVVIFGAGAIGRGLYGMNFRRSGYMISYVDIHERLVQRLRQGKRYTVVQFRKPAKARVPPRGARLRKQNEIDIDRVTADVPGNEDKMKTIVYYADAICLAVPDESLPEVCSLLGRCLEERVLRGNINPINVFLSTNRLNAREYIKKLIIDGVSPGNRSKVDEIMGVVETTVEGITRLGTKRQREVGSSMVYADPFNIFIADKEGFKGPIPEVVGMHLTDDITREKKRKLFLFNCTHSFIAYLGYLRGYTYIDEAWQDPWIKGEVRALLDRVSKALIKKYGFTEREQRKYIKSLESRFSLEALKDPVTRVGRDPLRKLSPHERFVGAARLIEEAGIQAEGTLALAIAACLHYDNVKDKQSKELQDMIGREGIKAVLRGICKIDPESRLGRLIIEKYNQFKEFGVAYAGLTLVNPKPTEGTTHVVIDFDGVVVNTIPIFRKHFAYIYWKIVNSITDDDKREPTEEELLEGKGYFNKILGYRYVGEVIPDIIKLALDKGIKPERLKGPDEYLAEYLERREGEINTILETRPESLLKPGIIEFLTELKKQKRQIYLLSTAPLDRLNMMMKKLGLEKFFDRRTKVTALEGKIVMLRHWIAYDAKKRPSNMVLIDDSPTVVKYVRDKIGKDLNIIAVREDVDGRELYPSANFMFDDLLPDANKMSIFLKTRGLTVPKQFAFPERKGGLSDCVGIDKLQEEHESMRRIRAAA